MKKYLLFFICLSQIAEANAQKEWKPFAGLSIAMNADGYYAGPSFSIGAIHAISKNKRWIWAPEMQFFEKKKKEIYSSSKYESAHFISWSVRSNFNYYTGKKTQRGFFIGIGLGFQYAKDNCYTYVNGQIVKGPDDHFFELKYGRIMPSINFGYSIPSKYKTQWHFIISGIGPYTERGENSSYTEILSVLSSGFRLNF
ncbi:MAG: hypothetical protein HZB42_15760 [Sphingobacteriales bacterium]|nr:hypothetical protein [Sphingobacteriales bacterium]